MRVIDENDEQLGILSTKEAILKAKEKGLDLVEVSPTTNPPVCKFLDYGKYLYRQSKIDHKHRVKQRTNEVKEIRLSPRISEHDLQTKANQAQKFLEKGARVKVNVIFKGRELSHIDIGEEKLNLFIKMLIEVASVETEAKRQGNTLSLTLKPLN